MVDLIRFNSSEPCDLDRQNLSFQAISEIFLGSSDTVVPRINEYSPPWAKFFAEREFKACEGSFRSLRQDTVYSVHPKTGKSVPLAYSFVPKLFSGMTLPVFKIFGEPDGQFCLAYCGLTARVTHIILKNPNCVIYDLDRLSAQIAWDAYQAHLPPSVPLVEPRRRIGIVDMVTSYAHQAMNHLSGLQRIIDFNLTEFVDEILVSGTEFFGKTENIFPELANKIRHVNRFQVLELLNDPGLDPIKIGSNIVTNSLSERLLQLSTNRFQQDLNAHGRWPLLAITVRTTNRRCVNLPDIVEEIVTGLLAKYPDLGVVLDGWVFPETSIIAESNVVTALSEPHLSKMREEALLCKSIAARLPQGVLVANLVGTSMLESLNALRHIDVYFSHVGTLQHKIAWFTRARGVVHGPQLEVSRMETSYYASETAYSPTFVGLDSVVDVPLESTVKPQFHDYKITNSTAIIHVLEELISNCNSEVSKNGGRRPS